MREVCVLFDFILTHAPSGYREVWQFAGVGSDTSDKWYSKASTSAEKFFVRRLFLMTTGDEDPDGGGEERAAKPHAVSNRAPAPSGSWVPSDAQKRLVFGKGKAAGIEVGDLRRLLWFIGGWTDTDEIDDRGKFDRLLEVIDGIGGDPDLQAEVAKFLESNPYPVEG